MSSNDSGNVDSVGDKPVVSNQRQQQPPKKRQDTVHRYQGTGMTPSIITTINNTSPTPLVNHSTAVNSNNNNNNNNNMNSINHSRGNRRTLEPYESYIEDSFVGHWEHEDDMDEYQEEFDAESHDGCDEDKSDLQHPSTVEFDFDSFGPESIIYTPTAAAQVKTSPTTTGGTNSTPITTTAAASAVTTTTTKTSSRPETLVEVSAEAEKADELTIEQQLSEEVKKVVAISDDEPLPPLVTTTIESRNESDSRNAITTQQHSDGPRLEFIERPSPTFSPYSSHDYLVDPAQIDLRVIEPYKKVISHAGYCHHFDQTAQQANPGEPAPAVIVFSACYLPDRSRSDYNYVMDHLFFYVLTSLHELIADDYILIYLHNTQPSGKSSSSNSNRGTANGSATPNMASSEGQNLNNLPTFTWMKRCYQMIDRRLRKNLKILYLVKPTFWLKTIVIMCKPFISTKFSKKLRFVEDMDGLRKCLPVDKLILPASAENL